MKKLKGVLFLFFGVVLLSILLFFVFFFDDGTKLNSEERHWISENETKLQNLSVINNSNIFGNLGEGIFYSFLKDFSEEYNLKLNPITINRNEEASDLVFRVGNSIPTSAITFYEDHFILVSPSKEFISSIQTIQEKRIGILESDADFVKNYLGPNNLYTVYNTEDELWASLEQGAVSYLIVPRIEYMNLILAKNYTIIYHFSDLKRYYYAEDLSNSVLFRIMKKYSIGWIEDYLNEKMVKEEKILFQTNLNIKDAAMAYLQKLPIVYGYRVHAPYEVFGDGKFGGIFSEFLSSFENFADVEMKYTKYNNDKKMIRDFNNGKITLYGGYDTTLNNGVVIDTSIPIRYDIYVHESNPIVLESNESFKNYSIYVEENTLLAQYLESKGYHLETYSSNKLNDVLKKKDVLIAIDHEKGVFLQNGILKHFTSRYYEVTPQTYVFRSQGSDTLNTLLSKYINYLDPHALVQQGYYSAKLTEKRGSFITTVAKYALYVIFLAIILLIVIYLSSKKVRMQKKVKKEDRLKYIDQLTSLKNRNYLNENLPNWNKNTIYPQSIIMIDLDKVQEINDTLGYEEGDKQIRAAANSLIKNQLDNSDIIRTDGNEFVVYLVGYNSKQITSYINKLKKDFKNLPSPYGVTLSYSMIESDLKNIEDALNECILDIKKQKELKKEEEK